jgi:hypothetical protein
MAQNKVIRIGPVTLGNATANILNPPAGSGGVGLTATNQYLILKHIRIVNRTASSATFSLFIGATGASAAGTEFIGNGTSVAANSYVDWYGQVRLDAADFLTGSASAASTLTFQAEGEIGVA